MVQKVTISVPDELHEKMQKWRDEFNFSQVFQNAISDLIEKKESFLRRLKEDENMETIIERLKLQKKKYEAEWFETGKNDGLIFAKSADYDDLKYALYLEADDALNRSSQLEDYFKETLDEYRNENVTLVYCDDSGELTEEFIEWFNGWSEAVATFWDEIQDKL